MTTDSEKLQEQLRELLKHTPREELTKILASALTSEMRQQIIDRVSKKAGFSRLRERLFSVYLEFGESQVYLVHETEDLAIVIISDPDTSPLPWFWAVTADRTVPMKFRGATMTADETGVDFSGRFIPPPADDPAEVAADKLRGQSSEQG